MPHGLDHVASAGLALGADHRGALGDPPERLPEVGGAADERHLEGPLVDVVGLVGRGEDLRLVDVVDLERLQDLGLGEVADPRLRHHRDGHGALDLLDLGRIRHAGHAPGRADVRRDALERHDGHGAGGLGDLGLLGGDHVHDHPALEHLGEPGLHAECGGVLHSLIHVNGGVGGVWDERGIDRSLSLYLPLPLSIPLMDQLSRL